MKKTLSLLLISAGLIATAQADDIPTYKLTIKDHRFSPEVLNVPADTRIKLQVKNEDATIEEAESQDMNFEKIIPAGGEGVLYIRPLAAGKYRFFGDFHQDTAKGEIVAK